MLCFSSDNRLLQTKGLECLRPEEGGVCRDIVVVYQDKDTAEPYLKALPRLRDDVITSALKVCPGQLCFLAPSSGLSFAFPLGFRWGGGLQHWLCGFVAVEPHIHSMACCCALVLRQTQLCYTLNSAAGFDQ